MHLPTFFLLSSAALSASAQTLLEAISNYPQLSNFTAFYSSNEVFANALFGNKSLYPITVLVPDDNAFAAYQKKTNISLTQVSPSILLPLVQYHTLVSSLGKDNFTNPAGTTAPTLLTGEQYNNRTVGSQMAAKFGGQEKSQGQVVFVKSKGSSSTKFILRQAGSASTDSIRSGMSSSVNMMVLEGKEGTWDGGKFHIIDGLLDLPQTCSKTIRGASLSSLDNALNRSELWPTLDSARNVTCLGPSNAAFKAAGEPDASLNKSQLADALRFHTLPLVAYSDFLTDGQEFQTLANNMTVRVKVEGEGNDRQIWFNNAKTIDANVLTHNGLMHVLDSVMTPLNESDVTASGTPRPSATASSTSTPSAAASSGAASVNGMGNQGWGVLGGLGAVLFFL
ncbi:FAS1 domain-containing protein [Zopfia rhizophila CBS 207.26]|uniref:FAS1 domain-containing protein n=1 Tax=Zopfia rhizophila CBS 207.26 TaxID=1314779 RepID=A0A6A6DQK5_9PEZI|nr:FAS1 domain-containing protein [Zopfia rhizophila CBS 207.26]